MCRNVIIKHCRNSAAVLVLIKAELQCFCVLNYVVIHIKVKALLNRVNSRLQFDNTVELGYNVIEGTKKIMTLCPSDVINCLLYTSRCV